MNGRKARDRFGNAPVLNKQGQPTIAAISDPHNQVRWGREPKILEALAAHRTLSIDEIWQLVGGDKRSLYETIAILRARPNEYIGALPEIKRRRNLGSKLILQLYPNGVEWLNDHGWKLPSPKRIYNIEHAQLGSHTTASSAVGIAQDPNARSIPLREIETHPKFPASTLKQKDPYAIQHPKSGCIRADSDLAGIELKTPKPAFRFYWDEYDNGTESITTRLREKFEAYLYFFEIRAFAEKYGLPNLFVRFIFTSRARMEHAQELLNEMTGGKGSRFILFKLAEDNAQPGYMYTTAYERVGYQPLYLNQP